MLLKIFFKIDYKNTFFSFVQINAQFQLSALTDLDDYNKFFSVTGAILGMCA